MKFSLKHIFFVAFLIAFALSMRALAITNENDGITVIGVIATAFFASFGFTILGVSRWLAWMAGVATTFSMCLVDTIERACMNPEMEYLWQHPLRDNYATDPSLGMLVTAFYTVCSAVICVFAIKAAVSLTAYWQKANSYYGE